MILTPVQAAQVEARLKELVTAPCPSCGTTAFFVARRLIFLPTESINMANTGDAIPSVALICERCGNIRLQSVFVLGLGETLGLTRAKE